MQRRKLEELSLMDDFLFNAMLTHPETGEKFTNKILKLLFNREFKNLRVSVQKVYKAFQYGYYDEMVSLLRNMFGNALKTNPNLYFAVLTGCLRISKESIFTGLNNLKVLTLTDVRFDEYFGFTDTEVKGMLEYYGLSGHYAEVKEWYDGYRFGNVEVYCPWDVINYCDLLRADPNALPQDYWSNTSGNAMVRRFIDKADTQTRDEIERLIAGDEILKEIHQELTYNELDSSIEVMLG